MGDLKPNHINQFESNWKKGSVDGVEYYYDANQLHQKRRPIGTKGSCKRILHAIVGYLNKDWVFLLLLGLIMAVLSQIVDVGITLCTNARLYFVNEEFASSVGVQYLFWVSLSVIIVLFAAGIVNVLSPHSAGSGIPEVRTSIRGVILKEYLTFKTLIAKVLGLICTLGSGMPLGKEGPFVHIASIVAHQLNKLFNLNENAYENESRKSDVLVAASAVGIAACFAAPVGGVFFSIEVTTTYFAVRNYWSGFFASVCGATAYRLFSVWADSSGTVEAPILTHFGAESPFGPQELLAFALMGVLCGMGGALFVWILNRYVIFMKSNKFFKWCNKANRFIYPTLVAFTIASMLFPPGLGMFISGESTFHDQMLDLYSNFTWTKGNLTHVQQDLVDRWSTPYTGVLINVLCYTIFVFLFSIIASTMPIPCGMFIPVMKIGAGLGRLFGEIMHLSFPLGFMYGGALSPIIPGGYAVVGTAAFAGAVTHTVSIAVIVFEMTGQITHVVPLMVAVLIAKAVAAALHPSMYDCMILIKKLPYLPDLLPANSRMYSISAEDFMIKDVQYIWLGITYRELKEIINANKTIKSFPLVENCTNMVLLGSVNRKHLQRIIATQINRTKKLKAASKWLRGVDERFQAEMIHSLDDNEESSLQSTRLEVEALQEYANDIMLPANAKKRKSIAEYELLYPTKSILKKTQSISSPANQSSSFGVSVRAALDSFFKKSPTIQGIDSCYEDESIMKRKDLNFSDSGIGSEPKRVRLSRLHFMDLLPEFYALWELEELSKEVDWSTSEIQVDPAPFQLVEKTTLPKVHQLFSMLGINHAYVTRIGQLVGVVSVKELRRIIEETNSKPFSSFGHSELSASEPLLNRKKREVVQTAV